MWTEGAVGFVCTNVPDNAVRLLGVDGRIKVIEEDYTMQNYGIPAGTQHACMPGCRATGEDYMWYLDRIDQPDYHSPDGLYHMCPEGRSIYAYVLDVGVRADHEQFTLGEPSSRVVKSVAFDDGSASGYTDTTDGCSAGPVVNYNLWHGTAVAGVLAGPQTGGAKPKIISVRFVDCYGRADYSWVVSALNWIGSTNDDHAADPAVVNYSQSWSPMATAGEGSAIRDALNALVVDRFKPVFVAAGNFAGDACTFTTNQLAYTNVNKTGRSAFVVGGTSFGPTDNNDYRWQQWSGSTPVIGVDNTTGASGGSNAGSCVSMYTPATDFVTAMNSSSTAYSRYSGTSFSAPLTAAVAVRYMEKYGINPHSASDVYGIYDYLLNTAASTGTPLYNVNTLEFWWCATSPQWSFYTTNPGSCPAGSGLNGSTTPVHFPAVGNDSNANILYSNLHIGDPNCP